MAAAEFQKTMSILPAKSACFDFDSPIPQLPSKTASTSSGSSRQ